MYIIPCLLLKLTGNCFLNLCGSLTRENFLVEVFLFVKNNCLALSRIDVIWKVMSSRYHLAVSKQCGNWLVIVRSQWGNFF